MASRIDQAWASQLERIALHNSRYFVRITATYCVVPSLCTDMGGVEVRACRSCRANKRTLRYSTGLPLHLPLEASSMNRSSHQSISRYSFHPIAIHGHEFFIIRHVATRTELAVYDTVLHRSPAACIASASSSLPSVGPSLSTRLLVSHCRIAKKPRLCS